MIRTSHWIAPIGLLAAASGIAFAASTGMQEHEVQKMVASCAVCHGSKGEGIEARSAPRLAGLDAAYLESQLNHFAAGARGTQPGDPFGPQMYVIAQSLGPEERKRAAAFYSKRSASAPHATIAKSAAQARGVQAYDGCAACHGADGMGNADIGAPRLAGQADWYILASLKAYRAGGRGYDPADMAGQQMKQAATALTDEDLAPVSAYASALGSN